MPDPRFNKVDFVDDLDDAAFLHVRGGGARDSTGKTNPRKLRLGPHHEPSRREIVGDRARHEGRSTGELNEEQVRFVTAQVNAGKLPMSPDDRAAAWEHLRQHHDELGIPMPPKRF